MWSPIAVLACWLLIVSPCQSAPLHGVRWEKDLQSAMYPVMQGGDACVRLVNREGTTGCSSQGLAADGPLWPVEQEDLDAGRDLEVPGD